MSKNNKINPELIDMIFGVVVPVITFFIFDALSFQYGLISFGLLPFGVGYLRGRKESQDLFVRLLLMNLLFLFLIFTALNGAADLLAIPLIALGTSYLGVRLRRSSASKQIPVILTSLGFFTLISIYSLKVLPVLLEVRLWTEEKVPAPEIRLAEMDEDPIDPATFEGKVMVLDFWATWCGPCISEFPELEKVQAHFTNNEKLLFYVVSSNVGRDTDQKVKDFIKENDYQLNFVKDPEGFTYDQFNIRSIPQIFLINDGEVVYSHSGFSDAEELESTLIKRIEELLEGND